MFEAMCRAMTLHQIRPVIDRVIPWTEAPRAIDEMANGGVFGKIVLSFDKDATASWCPRATLFAGLAVVLPPVVRDWGTTSWRHIVAHRYEAISVSSHARCSSFP
jgi:hypothetical protein